MEFGVGIMLRVSGADDLYRGRVEHSR